MNSSEGKQGQGSKSEGKTEGGQERKSEGKERVWPKAKGAKNIMLLEPAELLLVEDLRPVDPQPVATPDAEVSGIIRAKTDDELLVELYVLFRARIKDLISHIGFKEDRELLATFLLLERIACLDDELISNRIITEGLIRIGNENELEIVLLLAVWSGFCNLARMALDRGIGIDETFSDRLVGEESIFPLYYSHPLHVAVDRGHMDMVRLLVERGADVNAIDVKEDSPPSNPLRVAIVDGPDLEILRYLLQQGACSNPRDSLGWGALNEAALRQEPAVLELLLEYQTHDPAYTARLDAALRATVRNPSGNLVKCIDILLDSGADINAEEFDTGETPLHEASKWANPVAADYLIRTGASVMVQSSEGTPLHLVGSQISPKWMLKDQLSTIDVLLRNGAEVNNQSDGHLLAGVEPRGLLKLGKRIPLKESLWYGDRRFSPLLHTINLLKTEHVDTADVAERLEEEDPQGAQLLQGIHEKIAQLLYTPPGEIDITTPINTYGIDSMIAAELRNWLHAVLDLDVPLLTLLSPTTTINSLSELTKSAHVSRGE
ncbi:MAG: hypothetical protein Q9172_004195 [Xanthocarpia lactea]